MPRRRFPAPYKLPPAHAGDRLRDRGADPALPPVRRGRVDRPFERERDRPERLLRVAPTRAPLRARGRLDGRRPEVDEWPQGERGALGEIAAEGHSSTSGL